MMQPLGFRGPVVRLAALLVLVFACSTLLNFVSSGSSSRGERGVGALGMDLFSGVDWRLSMSSEEMRGKARANVMFGVSGPEVFAVGGCILSILASTSAAPNEICFYVAVSSYEEKEFAEGMLAEILVDIPGVCLEVAVFDFFPNDAWMYDTRPDLYSYVNYARFYVHELFPGVPRVVYLDYDTVVQADILELYNTDMQGYGLAAAENCEFELRLYLDLNFEHPLINNIYDPASCSFIAGVLLIDVDYWVKNNVRAQLEFFMEANLRSWPDFVYERGSQSPLNLVFANKFAKVDPLWQVYDLGWLAPNPPTQYMLDHGKILHWNGPRKPWTAEPLYPEKWRPYFPRFQEFMNRTAPPARPVTIYRDIPTRHKLKPPKREGMIISGVPQPIGELLASFLELFGFRTVKADFASHMGPDPMAFASTAHVTEGIRHLDSLRKQATPWVAVDNSAAAAALAKRGVFFKIGKFIPFRTKVAFDAPPGSELEGFCQTITYRPQGPFLTFDLDVLVNNPTKHLDRISRHLAESFDGIRPAENINKHALESIIEPLKAELAKYKKAAPACQNTFNQFKAIQLFS